MLDLGTKLSELDGGSVLSNFGDGLLNNRLNSNSGGNYSSSGNRGSGLGLLGLLSDLRGLGLNNNILHM